MIPHHRRALVIVIDDYKKTRTLGQQEGSVIPKFPQLPEVQQDKLTVVSGLKKTMGFFEFEITVLENPDFLGISQEFAKIRAFVREKRDKGETVLLYVYFAGHGIIEEQTKAVVNTDNPKRWAFPIEQNIRILGAIKGCFVFAVLDCCREMIKAAIAASIAPKPKPAEGVANSRGIGAANASDPEEWNCCAINFGCKAGCTVAGASTIAMTYF